MTEAAHPGNGRRPDTTDDPTTRTTELVDRAVDAFRAVMETRLAGMDRATELVAQALQAFRAEADIWEQRQRNSTTAEITALAGLLDARIGAMDKATELLAATVGRVPSDTDKQVNALRELLESRINGMDEATKLLALNVREVPTDIDKANRALREVLQGDIRNVQDVATKLLALNVREVPTDIDKANRALREVLQGDIRNVQDVAIEKFLAIDGTFSSNALALTAALAAQKEAAAEQNKSNTLAITKSEVATKEKIDSNAQQTATSLKSLADRLDDLKERVDRGEGSTSGSADTRSEQRLNTGQVIAALAVIVAVVSFILYVVKK